MTAAEMDIELGLTNRMKVVANQLRKFNQLEGETGTQTEYHKQIIKDGLQVIQEEGIRVYCRRVGEKYGVSDSTVKGDYSVMKRYGLIK